MRLIWLNFSYFVFINKEKKTTVGDLREVVKAMRKHGIPFSEIEFAIEEMEVREFNYAEFGILQGSFIFAQYKKEYDLKDTHVA